MIRIILILLLLLSTPCTSLANAELSNNIEKVIVAAGHENVGVKIQNLNTGQVLFQRHPNRFYNFASSVKLLTFANIYDSYRDRIIENKIIRKGKNLYLDIGDDADFTAEDLDLLVKQLRTKTKFINGDIYIIDRKFTVDEVNPKRLVEDMGYCYGAKISRTHINQNCYKLFASPGKNVGDPVTLTTDHEDIYNILNQARTIEDDSKKPRIQRNLKDTSLRVYGTLNISSQELKISPVTEDYIKHIKLFLSRALKENNISFFGQYHVIYKPMEGEVIAINKKNIDKHIAKALKNSDNFISDYYFALIATEKNIDEWPEAGKLFVEDISKRFDIDMTKSKMVDGSGLSSQNLFTIEQVSTLLDKLHKKPYFNTFKRMLCSPGEYGSLHTRLKDYEIYAKTGTMTGASSISGYLYVGDIPYSFVIVINNTVKSATELKAIEDKIIGVVYNALKKGLSNPATKAKRSSTSNS